MEAITILFVITLLAGFYMTWSIGANDVSNAIGTSVGSRALTLKQAVVIAAIFEFCGAFFFGSHVTETIESGIVNPSFFQDTPLVLVNGMLAVLLGAGTWLVIASYLALPVSTTHTIIGALVGFGVAIGGIDAIYWDSVTTIATSWIASPLMGGLLAYAFFIFIRKWIFFAPNPVLATKKYTPFIVFFFIFTFSFVFSYQDFEQFNFSPSLPMSLLIGTYGGGLAFVLAKIWLHRIVVPEPLTADASLPDLSIEVGKTKKYLTHLQLLSKGEMRTELDEIVSRFEKVSDSLALTTEEQLVMPDFHLIEKIFGRLQILSACMMAFSHGANDVANAIGPLSVAVNVLLGGQDHSTWLLALGGLGIVVGLMTWGWRVVETIGRKITELTPTRGFSAEFGAATTILVMSRLGFPISATHTLVGAVLGVGFARGIEALNLSTIRDIVASWIVTIPIGAASAIGFYYVVSFFFPVG